MSQDSVQFSFQRVSGDQQEEIDSTVFIERLIEFRRLVEEGSLDPKTATSLLGSIMERAQSVYPKRYALRAPLHEAFVWQSLFPSLNEHFVSRIDGIRVPQWAEGVLIVPKPTEVSGLEKGSCFKSHWLAAKKRILDLLPKSFPDIVDWIKKEHGEQYEDLTPATADALEYLCRFLPGDFLIIPFQSGRRWRNQTVRDGKRQFVSGEFGLCSYLIACLLYAHPERLSGGPDALNIICPGERRRPDTDSRFVWVPSFAFIKDELHCHAHVEWSDGNAHFGLATGYIDIP